MTNQEYFDMLKIRRSYHKFDEMNGSLTKGELSEIEAFLKTTKPLDPTIKVETKIVKKEETTLQVGEYAILYYSEQKEGWLENVGYIGEQADLFLESKGIGSCWYGIAKVEETEWNGLSFAIMIAIGKVPKETLRCSDGEFKRKPLAEVWHGENFREIGDIVRFAPSAVNSQVWLVEEEEGGLKLYRNRVNVGLIPVEKIEYFNKIDMGIFMFFLDTVLEKFGKKFERTLEYKTLSETRVLTSAYVIK